MPGTFRLAEEPLASPEGLCCVASDCNNTVSLSLLSPVACLSRLQRHLALITATKVAAARTETSIQSTFQFLQPMLLRCDAVSLDEYFQTFRKIVMSFPGTRLLKIKMVDPLAVDWGGWLLETLKRTTTTTTTTTAAAGAATLSLLAPLSLFCSVDSHNLVLEGL